MCLCVCVCLGACFVVVVVHDSFFFFLPPHASTCNSQSLHRFVQPHIHTHTGTSSVQSLKRKSRGKSSRLSVVAVSLAHSVGSSVPSSTSPRFSSCRLYGASREAPSLWPFCTVSRRPLSASTSSTMPTTVRRRRRLGSITCWDSVPISLVDPSGSGWSSIGRTTATPTTWRRTPTAGVPNRSSSLTTTRWSTLLGVGHTTSRPCTTLSSSVDTGCHLSSTPKSLTFAKREPCLPV